MSTVMTGAKAIFRINGQQVAWASSVEYNEEVMLEEVNTLDNIAVQEYAEVGYRVEMTCRVFRVSGLSPKGPLYNFMSKLQNILTQGVLTADITQVTDGAVIASLEQVKLATRQVTVESRGIMTETWTFKAIKATDEAGA